MKGPVPILILVLATEFIAPAPNSQLACERAGMNWDTTAQCTDSKM